MSLKLFVFLLVFVLLLSTSSFGIEIKIPFKMPQFSLKRNIPWWFMLSIVLFIVLIIYWKI